MSARPRSLCTTAADRLLDELDVRRPSEIEVELIAAYRGLSVIYKPLANEEGHLLRSRGGAGLIVVAESCRLTEKWRFVVAHELGHYEMHPSLDQFELCTDEQLRSWYLGSGHETEANHFASALLMPRRLCADMCDKNKPSLVEVRVLADEFRVSLTAAAIRFVDLSPEPCAVVYSQNGRVSWATRTKSFRFFIERGRTLDNTTYAGDLHLGKAVDDHPQMLDGVGWTDGEHVDVQEHSVALGRYGVLSLLWHQDS